MRAQFYWSGIFICAIVLVAWGKLRLWEWQAKREGKRDGSL